MKKCLSAILAVIVLVSSIASFGVTSLAVDDGGFVFTLNEDGQSYTISDDNNPETGALIIPSTHNGLPVTAIGDNAFYDNRNITSLSIPDSITTIGSWAFSGCMSIDKIVIPDSVTTMKNEAFYGCRDTTSITIGKGLTVLEDRVFSFTGIKTIDIPENIKELKWGVFFDCYRLEKIEIPANVTVIGYGVFAECQALKTVVFPDTVTSLGNRMFEHCTSLERVEIPEGITSLGEAFFASCRELKSIVLPASMKSIDRVSFYQCNKLSTIYYKGNNTQWKNIQVSKESNDPFFKATVICDYSFSDVKPITPKTKASNAVGGVKVTWNHVNGADKYVVYRREAGSSVWKNVGTTSAISFLDTTVENGKYYRYSIRAYDTKGEYSPYLSDHTSLLKYVATPKITELYNHLSGLCVKWNAVEGATGYRVYRRGAGETTWTYLGTTKNLYYIDYAVKSHNGKFYRYTIRAVNGYYSSYDENGPYTMRLMNPELMSIKCYSTGIMVEWEKVPFATYYRVYRKDGSDGTWKCVDNVIGSEITTYMDTSSKIQGITYTYTVRACRGSAISSYYSGIKCTQKY